MLHRAHGLAVEACVVDRDGGVIGEREEEFLVVRVEAARGNVEDADGADDETIRDARHGDDVADFARLAAALPERVIAGGGDRAEGLGGGDREVARIAVRGRNDHRAVLDESEPRAARVQQLGGVSHDECEHAIELERLVDALHDLGERARFARTLLGIHERNFRHHGRQGRTDTATFGRTASHFVRQVDSHWETSARVPVAYKVV